SVPWLLPCSTCLGAAGLAFLRPRINKRDHLPPGGRRIDFALGRGIETRVGSVASVHLVELRGARVGMPGVAVDLSNRNDRAEVDAEAATPAAGREEEVRRRLVPVGGRAAIVDRRQSG